MVGMRRRVAAVSKWGEWGKYVSIETKDTAILGVLEGLRGVEQGGGGK